MVATTRSERFSSSFFKASGLFLYSIYRLMRLPESAILEGMNLTVTRRVV